MNIQFKFLTCFKCCASGSKGSLYGIEDFREHYAVKHLDGFATRTCGTCQKSFATSFHCIWHARRGKCIPGKDRTIKLDATALDPIKVIKLNMAVSIAVVRHLFSVTAGQLDKSSLSFLNKVQADDEWRDCVEDLRFDTPANSFDPTDYYNSWYGASFPSGSDYQQSMSHEDIQAYQQYYECYQQAFHQNRSNLDSMFQELQSSNSPSKTPMGDELATGTTLQICSDSKENDTECYKDINESESYNNNFVAGSVSVSLTSLNTSQQPIEDISPEDSDFISGKSKTVGVPTEIRMRRFQLAKKILSAKRSRLEDDDMDIDNESVLTGSCDPDCFSSKGIVNADNSTIDNCEQQFEITRSCFDYEPGSSMELCSETSLIADSNVTSFNPTECITEARRVKEEPASDEDITVEPPANDVNGLSLKLEENTIIETPVNDGNGLSLKVEEHIMDESLPNVGNGLSVKVEQNAMDELPLDDSSDLLLRPTEKVMDNPLLNEGISLSLKREDDAVHEPPTGGNDLSLIPTVTIPESKSYRVKEEPADEDQPSPNEASVLSKPTDTLCDTESNAQRANLVDITEKNINIQSPPEKYRIMSPRRYRKYSSSSSDSSSRYSPRRSRSPLSSSRSRRRRARNRYYSSSSRSSSRSRSRSIPLRRRSYSRSISPIRMRRRRRSSERSDRGWRYGFVAPSVDMNRRYRRSDVRQRQMATSRRSPYTPERSPPRRQCSPSKRSRKDLSDPSVSKDTVKNGSPDSPPRRFVNNSQQYASKLSGQASDGCVSSFKVNSEEPDGPLVKPIRRAVSPASNDVENSALDLIAQNKSIQSSVVKNINESRSAKAQAMMSKIMNTLNRRAALRSVDPIASKPRDKAVSEARLYKKVRMIQRIKNNCSKKTARKRVVPVPSQPIFVPETDDLCTQLLELRPSEYHSDVDYFGILQRESSNIPLGCDIQGTDWSSISLRRELEKMTVTVPRNHSADSFPCFCSDYSAEEVNRISKSTSARSICGPSFLAKIRPPSKRDSQNGSEKVDLKTDSRLSSSSIVSYRHARSGSETMRPLCPSSGLAKPFGDSPRSASGRDRSFYDRLTADPQSRGRISEPNRVPVPDRRWPGRHSMDGFGNYFNHHSYYYDNPYFSSPQWPSHPAWYGGVNPPF